MIRMVSDWTRLTKEIVQSLIENVQCQVRGGFEQLVLLEGVPAHGSGVATLSFKVPFNPSYYAILYLYLYSLYIYFDFIYIFILA